VRGGKTASPFESHPRTPSGLKKSIKRREARCMKGDSWAEEGGKSQRKRESDRVGGSPSRLLCQVDEAGKDEKTDGERRNLQ